MKKAIISLVVFFAAVVAFAAPRRVALVVQNHTSNAPLLPLAALADTLTTQLSGSVLHVINPHNVVGVNQNRTAQGEPTPAVSAQELGRILNAEGIVTASILEFTSENIGEPPIAYTLKVRLGLNLVDAATGETVCGVSNVQLSKNYTAEQVDASATTLYEGLMHEAAAKCAAEFLAKVAASEWPSMERQELAVFFGCNVLGADLQIDGLSYGTCPGQFSLTPGTHNVVVSYPPYYQNFERQILVNAEGQTFAIVLPLTPEGEEQRLRTLEYEKKRLELVKLEREADIDFVRKKNDLDRDLVERCDLFEKQLALADAMLERYNLSGETDDYVRKTIAEGTAVYWKNSYGHIVITDGFADSIEFTAPHTDAEDLAVPPNPSEIAKELKRLLMSKLSQLETKEEVLEILNP